MNYPISNKLQVYCCVINKDINPPPPSTQVPQAETDLQAKLPEIWVELVLKSKNIDASLVKVCSLYILLFVYIWPYFDIL